MTTPPPPRKGAPGKPGGPLAALHGKPHVAIALGGAAVVVVVALVRKSSGSGSGSGSTATDTTGQAGAGTPTYDSTANDVYNSIESQLNQFQTQLDQMQNGLPSGTGSTTSGGASAPGGGTITSPTPTSWAPPGTSIGYQNPVSGAGGAASHLGVRPIRARKPLFSTVTVGHNQTLSGIAAAHHESLQTLLADNPVYKQNSKYRGGSRVWAGDKVRVR